MKTLYLSDLDGTLLKNDETLSPFTVDTINSLIEKGMNFSFATARSMVTAKKVTSGLKAKMPMIVYNGTFVMDSVTGEILISNTFDSGLSELFEDLKNAEVYPVTYSFRENTEKLSFVKGKSTCGQKAYLNSRDGDKRLNPVNDFDELTKGEVFYITCIDQKEKLLPLFEKYKDRFRCLYQKDYYTSDYWFEIMPKNVTKAETAKKLMKLLDCDRLVAFGDEINDIEIFKSADEAYAVENAVDEVKKLATDIIESNENDGVAKWLNKNYR